MNALQNGRAAVFMISRITSRIDGIINHFDFVEVLAMSGAAWLCRYLYRAISIYKSPVK